jgi:ATP-dependent helicase/nuclease subunit A
MLDKELNIALDPKRDVVVDACAGSGKTWLLASRIVRLLLSGVDASEILAITFTRKAAQEMKSRLIEWLRFLSVASDDEVREFLIARGISRRDASQLEARSRLLYGEYLTSDPGININTFHGWFHQILQSASWTSQSGRGYELIEDETTVRTHAWDQYFADVDAESLEYEALSFLYFKFELSNTHSILETHINSRLDWWSGSWDTQSDLFIRQWNELKTIDPLSELRSARFWTTFGQVKPLVERNGLKRELGLVNKIVETREADDLDACLVHLKSLFGKKRVPSAAMEQRLGIKDQKRFLEVANQLSEMVLDVYDGYIETVSLQMDCAVKIIGNQLISRYQSLKHADKLLDFSDLEWNVKNLLTLETEAAHTFSRLDTRYSHILVDEFQDTNPIQWSVLRSWIKASDEIGGSVRLFFVGDPKQSIYRFRRAEPRLFDVAKKLVMSRPHGHNLNQSQSYRATAGLTGFINSCFTGALEGFVEHRSIAGDLPTEVGLLGLVEKGASEHEENLRWRNPLVEPFLEVTDDRYFREGLLIADKISELVGGKCVRENGRDRPIAYSDILILVRRRTHLGDYEDALKRRRIPYAGERKGFLLRKREVLDLLNLLRFFLNPHNDYLLVTVLKSPIFSVSDSELSVLVKRDGRSIWGFWRSRSTDGDTFSSVSLSEAFERLQHWMERADVLPVHDLLDLIYRQDDLVNRYQDVALPIYKRQVKDNLHAFLEYSLDVTGGRYPSVERFVRHIDTLLQTEGAGPSEGDGTNNENIVRIMTIHGAKGLESPIVFLADSNARADQKSWDILVDWIPGEDTPRSMVTYGSSKYHSANVLDLLQKQRALDEREDLNLLYVALTRAKQAFYASGVESSKSSSVSWYSRIQIALEEYDVSTELPINQAVEDESSQSKSLEPFILRDHKFPKQVGERIGAHSDPNVDLGIAVHRILELVSNDSQGWDRVAVRQLVKFGDDIFDEAWDVSNAILHSKQLTRFFDASQFIRASNELAYLNEEGEVRRVDRFVEFDSESWILDYKITRDDSDELDDEKILSYTHQLSGYKNDLSKLYATETLRMGIILRSGVLIELH